MKLKKVLLLLTESTDRMIIEEVVQACKRFKSKLFVLFVMEPKKISQLASMTRKKYTVLHKETEEEGWQMLYLVEDEATKNSVWTSLHLEEGILTNVVKKFISAYKLDCVFVKRKSETRKLFLSCPAPIIGL